MEQTQHPARINRLADPNWKYRRACETDVRKTFERVRREQERREIPTPFDDMERPQ